MYLYKVIYCTIVSYSGDMGKFNSKNVDQQNRQWTSKDADKYDKRYIAERMKKRLQMVKYQCNQLNKNAAVTK